MAPSIRLGRPTRRRVQKLDRKTRDADLRVRCRVILEVADGMSRHAAALAVGCAPSTAWWIVDRFVSGGEASLLDGRCDNGERKVDEDILEGIWQILTQTPRDHGYSRNSWTLELLAGVVAEKMSVQLSIGHLWKVVRRLRIRWGRPRAVVGCPWKAAKRRRRIARLRALANDPPPREAVLYADEVDIHLNPKIGFDWMLPGVQRLILTPGKNEKRYLAGAFDPLRQRMVYVEGLRKSSWLFLALLDTPEGLRLGASDPSHPRQLHDSQEPLDSGCPQCTGQNPFALPSPVLPLGESDRTRMARPPRKCHP